MFSESLQPTDKMADRLQEPRHLKSFRASCQPAPAAALSEVTGKVTQSVRYARYHPVCARVGAPTGLIAQDPALPLPRRPCLRETGSALLAVLAEQGVSRRCRQFPAEALEEPPRSLTAWPPGRSLRPEPPPLPRPRGIPTLR